MPLIDERLLPGKPEGVFVLVRLVGKRTGRQYSDYKDAVIRPDNWLCMKWADNWWLYERLLPRQRDYLEQKCYKSREELDNFLYLTIMHAA